MTAEAVPDLERMTRKFRPALVAFFSRRVASHAEAEDLTQEVFVRLAQSQIGALDSTDAFVFRIATNLLRDRARRDRVRTAYRQSVEQEDGIHIDILDPHRVAAARETIGILWAAIQALPEPTQQIFILYRVENIQKQTIADNFGYNVRTVEKHISRALMFLARRMGGRA
ncbi:MAG: sigma-70 family RNA polymerase sigma factor [Sphingopyxis sp.]|uniref:RNA polymerase sigma factor n=1 Tax=Sphingopyxis sp. TaxID=1908224 RepID=UPI002ABCDEFF|nr:sigma-70 family RNA polymerase sigma factor [Sphingopyxis sp.]MDZ3833386.1 sigma-70 family RNA polymerase sigma factor [Sphingopyxis sp.]